MSDEQRPQQHVRAVTFDFHNTIAHCDQWFQLEIRTLVPAVLDHFATQHGLSVTPDMRAEAQMLYRELRMQIMEHGNDLDATQCALWVLERMQPALDLPAPDVHAAIDIIMHETLAEAEPVPGSIETIRQLHAAGIPLGVISAAVHHEYLEWTLEKFQIREAFTLVVTTASAGLYKTRPELYQGTVAALGSVPEQTLHIGDSYRLDVLGARAAGLHAAWYNRGDGHTVADIEHAAFVVTSMADVPEALAAYSRQLAP